MTANELYYQAWHLLYELECARDAADDAGDDERAERCRALIPRARDRMHRRKAEWFRQLNEVHP